MRWQRPEVSNWAPFDQWSNLREEINRLFDAPFGDFGRETEFFSWAPAVDVYEDKDSLVVKAELPGLTKDAINISLHQVSLLISGERKSESLGEDAETSRSERFFGRFQRALELPKPVDPNRVTAVYKDGLLTVTLPKTEESKPKQINVKAR